MMQNELFFPIYLPHSEQMPNCFVIGFYFFLELDDTVYFKITILCFKGVSVMLQFGYIWFSFDTSNSSRVNLPNGFLLK
jgi:hypothetical protein